MVHEDGVRQVGHDRLRGDAHALTPRSLHNLRVVGYDDILLWLLSRRLSGLIVAMAGGFLSEPLGPRLSISAPGFMKMRELPRVRPVRGLPTPIVDLQPINLLPSVGHLRGHIHVAVVLSLG